MERMKPPSVPDQPVAVVDDDAARQPLKITGGAAFDQRRDHAIIRLFLASGCAAASWSGSG
jgi:integrase/recombinase XerC